jgi:hypothetical protein
MIYRLELPAINRRKTKANEQSDIGCCGFYFISIIYDATNFTHCHYTSRSNEQVKVLETSPVGLVRIGSSGNVSAVKFSIDPERGPETNLGADVQLP